MLISCEVYFDDCARPSSTVRLKIQKETQSLCCSVEPKRLVRLIFVFFRLRGFSGTNNTHSVRRISDSVKKMKLGIKKKILLGYVVCRGGHKDTRVKCSLDN